MRKLSMLLALGACVALAACDLIDNRRPVVKDAQAEREAANPPMVLAAQSSSAGSSAPAPAAGREAAGLPDFTPLMKQNGPAVVNVISTKKGAAGARQRPQAQPDEDPLLEFFRRFSPGPGAPGGPGGPGGEPRAGLGSGFIISADGYILTNAHLVMDFDEVMIKLADTKREFKARVVGADKRTDVALLKVEAKDLPVARLGDSKQLEPGQWVAAIGSPFGFTNTITAGIVSATQRALPDETYVPFIQTDVAVNPGNSGGPLINLKGDVVGINSLIYSRTGGYMGLSFAIPIEVALDVAKQLQASGRVTRGRLGVGIQPMTRELSKSFGLEQPSGAVVTAVEANSPAAKAGLKTGDVILAYNGKKVDDPNELPRLVGATKPGDKADLEIWRNGKRQTLGVTVGEFPAEVAETARQKQPEKRAASNELGLALRDLAPDERKALGVEYGLVVVDVTAEPAMKSPIQPGDVILAVNQERFRNLDEFRKLVAERRKNGNLALLVKRGESAIFVPIETG
jgi:serine protease Do